ncbi:rhodanese-like domain-containing protein [Prochlorococcus marinus]|uniref:Rhodanese-like protein n=1 Tax=Prochlorococcus marinus (strain MIT 9211) TaxID=93059 RepID=A9BD23_PROM4|nr:rhodanese-like domain-containing protein [Prochlorococcus marinus]ABX08111.1 Rhodanese-like protein [Prochlorococcus marinus str. MIT 9211]
MTQNNPKEISARALDRWLQNDSSKPLLVDVREKQELLIAPFSHKVLNIPLSEAVEWADDFLGQISDDQSIVVICHSGIRSWNFGIWLIEQKCGCEVWNLSGGIDSWSLDVDPSVPRY